MRSLANTVFLLIVALFGLGFLLDHSINLSRELTETRAQLTRMQAEVQSLQAQYQAILNEKNQLYGQVSKLANENSALQARVQTLDSERQALDAQITVLQRQVYLIQNASPWLAWLVSIPKGHLMTALIFVPVLPLSLGAVYVVTHSRNTSPRFHLLNRTGTPHDQIQATLTREEVRFLARHRRAQLGGGT